MAKVYYTIIIRWCAVLPFEKQVEEVTTETSQELVPIPEGWFPIDLLHALMDVDRIEIYKLRK